MKRLVIVASNPNYVSFDLKEEISSNISKIAIVFNLDKHTGPGTHWTSMFVDIKDKIIFYFDSNGTAVPKRIKKIAEQIQEQGKILGIKFKFYENHPFTHQYTNSGVWNVYFIFHNHIFDKQSK